MYLLSWASAGCTPRPRPSIVLVSLDTFRADRIGAYGYEGGLTPNLDALASESVLFEDVTATVPLTTPSHASILTGAIPQRHGVRSNESARLDDGIATLAESLRDAGYRTGAFVGAFPLSSRSGLSRGFDVYDEDFSNAGGEERPAEAVLGRALSFIDEAREDGTPYFAFVHLFDAHSPYEPPLPFAESHREDPYGGEIAHVDAALGRFFDSLRDSGEWTDLAMTVVADHGESLGEHGENTHGALVYQSTTRIPWIWKMPGGRWAGLRIASPVRAIDVAPTLLGALEIRGLETADGVDLTPFLERGDLPELPVYSETLYLHLLLGWSELRSLRLGELKFIDAPTPELYDLANDPAESESVLEERPREARRLRAELERLRDVVAATPASPGKELQERLSALGYLSGATALGRAGIDPKQAMPIWREIESASALLVEDPERAHRHLELAIELDPENGLAMKMLGDLALEAGDVAGADRWIAASRDAGFHHSDLEVASIRVDLARGRPESALDRLRTILKEDPDDGALLGLLGESLRRLGRLAEAERTLRRALASRPEDARIYNELGAVLASDRRPGEARDAFRRAVELDPDAAQALTNLARLSEGEEAVALLRRAIESSASLDSAAARIELAKLLAAAGALEEASMHAESALALRPADPEALFVVARVADLKGDLGVAADLYRSFLSLAPPELAEAASMAKRRLREMSGTMP